MSDEKQEIAEKIRNGSYFTEANNWYAGKYIYPETERSMMLLFAIAAILALLPIVFLLKTTVQANNKVPFPITVADLTSTMPVIQPLMHGDETPQEAVAKYLISDYIKSREEYIYNTMNGDKLKKLLKKVKSSSAKPVLNEYVSYMSERNPYSPLVRYKDHTNRYINIKSITFSDTDQTSGKARVIFEATEKPNNGEEKISLWEVTMNLKLPDIAILVKSGAPLRFIVGYYKIRPLSEEDIKAVNNTKDTENKKEDSKDIKNTDNPQKPTPDDKKEIKEEQDSVSDTEDTNETKANEAPETINKEIEGQ